MLAGGIKSAAQGRLGKGNICTEPVTFTTTVLLPASTGMDDSAMSDLALMAIARWRGIGPWSFALTDTSRRL